MTSNKYKLCPTKRERESSSYPFCTLLLVFFPSMPAQTRKRQRQEEEQESKTQGQMASAGWIVTESDGSIIRLSKKNNNLVVLLSSSPPSPILSSPTSWSLSVPPSPSPSFALSSLSPTASVREFSS